MQIFRFFSSPPSIFIDDDNGNYGPECNRCLPAEAPKRYDGRGKLFGKGNFMVDWFVTYRGIVLPRHCDHYGHLNVRFYAQFFDDAGFQMLHLAGVTLESLRARGLGAVIANISIDFVAEIKAGELMRIEGVFRRIGGKSLTHEQRLYAADSDRLCATQTGVEVFFDLEKRVSAPIPDDIRRLIEPLVVAEAN